MVKTPSILYNVYTFHLILRARYTFVLLKQHSHKKVSMNKHFIFLIFVTNAPQAAFTQSNTGLYFN